MIGKELGRRPDDCKQMLIKLGRKRSGKFSLDEDKSLFSAIRKATGIRASILPQHLEIPWTNVANYMNNQRTALDYHRRFLTIEHLHYQKGYPEVVLEELQRDNTVKVFVHHITGAANSANNQQIPNGDEETHTFFIRRSDQEVTRHKIRLLEYLNEW